MPAAVVPHIRTFPRHDRPAGPVNAIGSRVKVVLRDGCFRAADRDNALLLFPFGANLFVDSENYLAFGSEEVPGYARVGETVQFIGSVNEVIEPELVDPILAACGPGRVIKVEGLESAAARDLQQASDDDVNALRSLQSRFGLDEAQARRAYNWLERQQAKHVQTDANGIRLPPHHCFHDHQQPAPAGHESRGLPAGQRAQPWPVPHPGGIPAPAAGMVGRVHGAGSMRGPIFAIAAVLGLTACATTREQTERGAASEAISHDVTSGQARPAARLYPKLAKAAGPNDNLFISPLSLSEGLGLALLGARGQTEMEMRGLMAGMWPRGLSCW